MIESVLKYGVKPKKKQYQPLDVKVTIYPTPHFYANIHHFMARYHFLLVSLHHHRLLISHVGVRIRAANRRVAETPEARALRLQGVRDRAAANRLRVAAEVEDARRQRSFLTNLDQPLKNRNAYYNHPSLPAYRNDYDFYKAKVCTHHHSHLTYLHQPHLT